MKKRLAAFAGTVLRFVRSVLAPTTQSLFHPDSPGVRVEITRTRFGRWFKPADFATLGEMIKYHRANTNMKPDAKGNAPWKAVDMNDETEPISTVAVDPIVSAFSEDDCLACGPFDGDFGSPDDRILGDKMVTARKGGECFLCAQKILPGERIRTMAAVFDGELMSYRWCNACCAAMAKSWLDGGDAYDEWGALAR